jgi:ethanolamine utilization protein EutN
MRVAETIGKVTLNKCHPSVQGATWLLAVPLTLEGLAGNSSGRGEPFVIFDELGAGFGSRIAVSEGAEAAVPFYPATKPIDAYNAAILDTIEFETS